MGGSSGKIWNVTAGASGGGAATNLGIGFQHRIGALVLAAMLIRLDPLVPLQMTAAGREVEQVRFETDDEVDDLVLVTTTGRIFVQAKRSVSLSESPSSEFMAVIRQFVRQYLRESREGDAYALVTSPRASGRIVTDLRKLTVASRMNALGSAENPLTVSERRTLEVTRQAITQEFQASSGRNINESERDEIFRRVHVISLAVEDGGDQERAVLTLLAAQATVEPSLIWRDLIVLALDLAGRRSSIDRAGLMAHAGHWLSGTDTVGLTDQPRFIHQGSYRAGWEIVLAWMEDRLVVADIQRFDEKGARRVRFVDGAIEFGDGTRWPIEYRSATVTGLQRFLRAPEGKHLTEGREVLIMESKLGTDPEDSFHAKAHAERCRLAFEANQAPLECLRCGRSISEESALQVEIDEEGLPYEVGLLHSSCRLPTHRILGTIANEAFRKVPVLTDFDLKAWFASIFSGQGFFAGVPEALRSRPTPVYWKPGTANLSTARWCLSYQLDNGDVLFVRERGQIHRMTERQARQEAATWDQRIAIAAAEGDPLCVSDRTGAFGRYSTVIRSDPTSAIRQVARAEARVASRAVLYAHRTCDNYYAPLLALIDASTNEPLTVHDQRVLLTNPLQIEHYLQNWHMSGAAVGALDSVVLKSDEAFDRFVYSSLSESIGVLIDPIFAIRGDLLAGAMIFDFRACLAAAPEHHGSTRT